MISLDIAATALAGELEILVPMAGLIDTSAEVARLEKEILEKMHSTLKIGPKIFWLKPNTLERATKKTQLFEKNYE